MSKSYYIQENMGEPMLAQALTALKGVGPNNAKKLQKLGIYTIQDLLFHLPLRYQDRTKLIPFVRLVPGVESLVEGVVCTSQVIMRGRRMLLVGILEGTRVLYLRFFHFSRLQQQSFREGKRVRCFGEVHLTKQGLEIIHPEYCFIEEMNSGVVEKTLTPVYPITEGLSQLTLRKLIAQALLILENHAVVTELIPAKYVCQYQFPSLKEALMFLHRPLPDTDLKVIAEGCHPFQRRLAFEELLAHHVSLRRIREQIKIHQAFPIQVRSEQFTLLKNIFLNNLAFQLTHAQQRVLQEILTDLSQAQPMLRLVQGDVGSGKTVVAALTALCVVAMGYQVAVMAPTELLAEQHYRNFHHWFDPLNISVGYLSGSIQGKKRNELYEKIKTNALKVIVGTHALFQKDVHFYRLALIIVDEQHRFGVNQRLALREKGAFEKCYPHQLMMTATPIPRTLAMSIYADLDCSIIDELPPGRSPIKTVVIANDRRNEVVERIRYVCQQGRQVYWVCTLIEESEVLQAEAAEKTIELLISLLPQLNIGLLHGRMKAVEKEKTMQLFQSKTYDLLVATTVIEVGVDVPNASLMVIENAERLGLLQLHQLRGRVGRGSVESYCILLYQSPLGYVSKTRLEFMRETTDGFKIAEKDLELRGAGEVLGTRQTGLAQMKMANLIRDQHLLPQVQIVAQDVLSSHIELIPLLMKRWLIEGAEEFARV